MDTGPILLQEKFPISPFDTGKSLYRKTLEFEPQVIEKCLKKIETNDLEFLEQAKEEVEHYPNRVPEHSQLDIKQSLESLINKIKAADPENYPAYFNYNGKKIGVKLFRIEKTEQENDMI